MQVGLRSEESIFNLQPGRLNKTVQKEKTKVIKQRGEEKRRKEITAKACGKQ
jgi:hypothetical protein